MNPFNNPQNRAILQYGAQYINPEAPYIIPSLMNYGQSSLMVGGLPVFYGVHIAELPLKPGERPHHHHGDADSESDEEGGRFHIPKGLKKLAKSAVKELKPVGRAAAKEAKSFARDVLEPAGKEVKAAAKAKAKVKVAEAKEHLIEKIDNLGTKEAPPEEAAVEGGKFNIGRTLRKLGKELKPAGKAILKETKSIVAPAANDVLSAVKSKAKEAVQQGAQNLVQQIEGANPAVAEAAAGLKKKRGQSAKMKERNELVKKVRAKMGGSIIDASKYIKEHGLYKG